AYRFGLEKEIYRSNDDGEPNNSAGAPILGQIQSYDLTNVLICVLRYYGGTKLGVGGLINAYRTGAKEAIENGKIITCTVYQRYEILFEYADMPAIMKLVKDENLTIKEQLFEISCKLVVAVDLDLTAKVFDALDNFETTEIKDLGIY
ncbi:MAG: IMPACT family protein, partial [Lishizhenia sp.]